MGEERTMVLKMLKEGKISLEEAEALLDVLENKEESRGESSTEEKAENRERRENHCGKDGHHYERHHESRQGPSGEEFHFDFDFSGLNKQLRSVFSQVKNRVKDAMQDMENMDVNVDLERIFGGVKGEAELKFSFSTGGVESLSLANVWGNTVVSGSDGEEIQVKADVRVWSDDEEKAESLARSFFLSEERTGPTLVLSSSQLEGRRMQVNYHIFVPRHIAVWLETASGELRLENLEGGSALSTASGDVYLDNLCGTNEVTTKSGEVHGHLIGDMLRVRSTSGEIHLEDIEAVMELETKSGDVLVRGDSGEVKIRTVSGDIGRKVLEAEHIEIGLSSVSGDLRLSLPEDADTEIQAETVSGDFVNRGLPLNITEQTERKLRALMGKAEGRVFMRTVSGDIFFAGATID